MASPDAIANWRKAFSSGRTALKDTRKLLAQETNQSLVAQILTESKGLDIAGKAWNKHVEAQHALLGTKFAELTTREQGQKDQIEELKSQIEQLTGQVNTLTAENGLMRTQLQTRYPTLQELRADTELQKTTKLVVDSILTAVNNKELPKATNSKVDTVLETVQQMERTQGLNHIELQADLVNEGMEIRKQLDSMSEDTSEIPNVQDILDQVHTQLDRQTTYLETDVQSAIHNLPDSVADNLAASESRQLVQFQSIQSEQLKQFQSIKSELQASRVSSVEQTASIKTQLAQLNSDDNHGRDLQSNKRRRTTSPPVITPNNSASSSFDTMNVEQFATTRRSVNRAPLLQIDAVPNSASSTEVASDQSAAPRSDTAAPEPSRPIDASSTAPITSTAGASAQSGASRADTAAPEATAGQSTEAEADVDEAMHTILQAIDAYDADATDQRILAANLPPETLAVLSPHLGEYRNPDEFDKLVSACRGKVRCVSHVGLKSKNPLTATAIDMRNPSRCPSCDLTNSLCILKLHPNKPVIMPLAALKRTGRDPHELQYWVEVGN